MSKKLNLGCGEDTRDGWVNVDIDRSVGADRVVDLDQPEWPFESGKFTVVEARHVLEHLTVVPWTEITRILAPGGEFVFVYPIGHTRFEDPTHEQFWGWHTAEKIAGERGHSHEIDVPLRIQQTDWSGEIAADPITRFYARYRLAVQGPGPWLEQIPGFAGERRIVYKKPC